MKNISTLLVNLYAAQGDNHISDVAIEWGSLQISWYGILAFIGFAVAIAFAACKIKFWYKIPLEPFFWFCFIAIPTAIIGARSWSYIIGDSEFVGDDFWDWIIEFFKFKGMAIQGGVILTVFVACIYFPIVLRKPRYHVRTLKDGKENVKEVSMFLYADAIIPCILIGQLIGRWGNFINGELYGSIVPEGSHALDWLKYCMPAVYDGMWIYDENLGYVLRQPMFLYESFADFCAFILLYVGIEFIKQHKAGDIAAGYFISYGIIRIIMEPLRDAKFNFVATYIVTGLMLVGGIIFIIVNHLVLIKHRNFRVWYFVWIWTSYQFIKLWALINPSFRAELMNRDPNLENYGLSRKPVFIRNPNEIYYYKGH